MNAESIVISNSGPLIALGKLNRLDLLASIYTQVHIPRAVYTEVVTQGLIRGASEAAIVRHFWQQQRWAVVDLPDHLRTTFTPTITLDPGEIEVLTLATSLQEPLVLMDDELARTEARRLQLRVRGTIGVIVEAFRRNVLTFEFAT